MSSLFLKYPKNTLVQIDTIPKVNISTVIRVVTSIVPPNSTPLNYKAVDDGYLLTFANEKSINSFFTPANIIKLKEFNLTPTLSPHSKNNREIYIPGVTKYIYYLPKDKIIAEIKQKNNIDCLIINLFTSTGGTRYLVITTDSRASRDNILKSSVKLFDTEFKPQPKLQTKQPQQQSPLRSYNAGGSRAPVQLPSQFSQLRRENRSQSSSWRNPPSPTYEFYRIDSAQANKVALPRNSDWAGPRRTTVTPSTDKTNLTVLKPRARPNTPSKIRPTTGAPPSTPSMCVPSYPEVAPPPAISVNPVLQQRQVTPVIDHSLTPPIQPVRQEPRPDLPAATTRNENQQQNTHMPSLHVPSKPPQQKQNHPQ